jgi:hypothetical protein
MHIYIMDLRPWRWSALNMGICSQAAFKNARAILFVFGRDGHLFSGGFEKMQKFRGEGCPRPPGSDTLFFRSSVRPFWGVVSAEGFPHLAQHRQRRKEGRKEGRKEYLSSAESDRFRPWRWKYQVTYATLVPTPTVVVYGNSTELLQSHSKSSQLELHCKL